MSKILIVIFLTFVWSSINGQNNIGLKERYNKGFNNKITYVLSDKEIDELVSYLPFNRKDTLIQTIHAETGSTIDINTCKKLRIICLFCVFKDGSVDIYFLSLLKKKKKVYLINFIEFNYIIVKNGIKFRNIDYGFASEAGAKSIKLIIRELQYSGNGHTLDPRSYLVINTRLINSDNTGKLKFN